MRQACQGDIEDGLLVSVVEGESCGLVDRDLTLAVDTGPR